MALIHLWRVAWGGGPPSAFQEAVDAVAWGLAELGHDVTISDQPSLGRCIAFGTNILPPGIDLPSSVLVFNLEQWPRWKSHLPRLYADSLIWNYDPVVQERFVAAGLRSVLVPFGWTPNLGSPLPPGDDSSDVLFLGGETPYRQAQVEALRKAGLKVTWPKKVFGPEREPLFQNAKVVLSLRSFPDSPFMPLRILPAWARGRVVASDRFEGAERHEFGDALVPLEGEALVADTVRLCRDPEMRAARLSAAQLWLASHPYLPGLRAAVERWLETPEVPPSPSDLIRFFYCQGNARKEVVNHQKWMAKRLRGNALRELLPLVKADRQTKVETRPDGKWLLRHFTLRPRSAILRPCTKIASPS